VAACEALSNGSKGFMSDPSSGEINFLRATTAVPSDNRHCPEFRGFSNRPTG